MNDDVNDRLRVTAEAYEPDRDRMWSRISDGMREPRVRAEPVRTGWRIPQLGLATGAAVMLIGAMVFFGQAMGLGPGIGVNPEPPAAGPGTRSEEASDPATSDDITTEAEQTSSEETETQSATESATETESETSPEPDSDVEWLWTDGSVDPGSNEYWSQANLVLKNEEALTAVSVELRVAGAEFLDHTGSWTTDSRFTDAEVTEEDGFLVYRWELRDGAVLPVGQHTLAAQFNHGGGPRHAEDDFYTFDAETESGHTGSVEGDFE
jgi:hypothetical protein